LLGISDFPRAKSRTIQAWFVVAMLFVLIGSLVWWVMTHDRLPKKIVIATGKDPGGYFGLAEALQPLNPAKQRTTIIPMTTNGSVENKELLLTGEVQAAIVQNGTVSLENLAVVATLHRDVVHLLVRNDGAINKIADLEGHKIAIGPVGSGMNITAIEILEHFELHDQVETVDVPPETIASDESIDAAIMTTGIKARNLKDLLSSDNYRFLNISQPRAISVKHPFYEEFTIPAGLYAELPPVPVNDVSTIATTSLLVVREGASNSLVECLAKAVDTYNSQPRVTALTTFSDVTNLTQRNLHPAAYRFYNPYDVGWASSAVESLAATYELLFAFGAGMYLVVTRWQHIKKREEAERVSLQKERLDTFLDRTLKIERAQIGLSDSEKLHVYLAEVTAIKLEALSELTHEELRGDRTFSIFLMQCANLISKIQLKIIASS